MLAVSVGSLSLPLPASLFNWDYDAVVQHEFEQSFRTLRHMPADIFLASHDSFFDLKRKIRERATARSLTAPFIDRIGYLNYINKAEQSFHKALNEQQTP